MGTNNLTTRTDGETIPASDHNELVQALLIDHVPRNNSRVPEDIIGSLGRSDLRWLRAFVKEYFIGTAANNLKLYEGAAGELWLENPNNDRIKITNSGIVFQTNNVTRFTITDTGIDWSGQPDASIPLAKVDGFVPISYSYIVLDTSISVSHTFTTYAWIWGVPGSDFDNGAKIAIDYQALSFTPAHTEIICDSAAQASPMYYVKPGDVVKLVYGDPTRAAVHIIEIPAP